MEGYDESQDIDALLRSSLRIEPTNPPGVGGGAPESEETAARRQRIRAGDANLEDIQPLCTLSDEQQAVDERAAMLRAAMPEASRFTNTDSKPSHGKNRHGPLEGL